MKSETIHAGEIQKICFEQPQSFMALINELICCDIDFQYVVDRENGESYLYIYCTRDELKSITSGINL